MHIAHTKLKCKCSYLMATENEAICCMICQLTLTTIPSHPFFLLQYLYDHEGLLDEVWNTESDGSGSSPAG